MSEQIWPTNSGPVARSFSITTICCSTDLT